MFPERVSFTILLTFDPKSSILINGGDKIVLKLIYLYFESSYIVLVEKLNKVKLCVSLMGNFLELGSMILSKGK
jgi:hypothetical protein